MIYFYSLISINLVKYWRLCNKSAIKVKYGIDKISKELNICIFWSYFDWFDVFNFFQLQTHEVVEVCAKILYQVTIYWNETNYQMQSLFN